MAKVHVTPHQNVDRASVEANIPDRGFGFSDGATTPQEQKGIVVKTAEGVSRFFPSLEALSQEDTAALLGYDGDVDGSTVKEAIDNLLAYVNQQSGNVTGSLFSQITIPIGQAGLQSLNDIVNANGWTSNTSANPNGNGFATGKFPNDTDKFVVYCNMGTEGPTPGGSNIYVRSQLQVAYNLTTNEISIRTGTYDFEEGRTPESIVAWDSWTSISGTGSSNKGLYTINTYDEFVAALADPIVADDGGNVSKTLIMQMQLFGTTPSTIFDVWGQEINIISPSAIAFSNSNPAIGGSALQFNSIYEISTTLPGDVEGCNIYFHTPTVAVVGYEYLVGEEVGLYFRGIEVIDPLALSTPLQVDMNGSPAQQSRYEQLNSSSNTTLTGSISKEYWDNTFEETPVTIPDHDNLSGLNVADYQHLTQAQVALVDAVPGIADAVNSNNNAITSLQNDKQDNLPDGVNPNHYLGWNGSDWASRQVSYSEITGTPTIPAIPDHNDLDGLQGGSTGQRNHLTNAQVNKVDGIPSEYYARKISLTSGNVDNPNTYGSGITVDDVSNDTLGGVLPNGYGMVRTTATEGNVRIYQEYIEKNSGVSYFRAYDGNTTSWTDFKRILNVDDVQSSSAFDVYTEADLIALSGGSVIDDSSKITLQKPIVLADLTTYDFDNNPQFDGMPIIVEANDTAQIFNRYDAGDGSGVNYPLDQESNGPRFNCTIILEAGATLNLSGAHGFYREIFLQGNATIITGSSSFNEMYYEKITLNGYTLTVTNPAQLVQKMWINTAESGSSSGGLDGVYSVSSLAEWQAALADTSFDEKVIFLNISAMSVAPDTNIPVYGVVSHYGTEIFQMSSTGTGSDKIIFSRQDSLTVSNLIFYNSKVVFGGFDKLDLDEVQVQVRGSVVSNANSSNFVVTALGFGETYVYEENINGNYSGSVLEQRWDNTTTSSGVNNINKATFDVFTQGGDASWSGNTNIEYTITVPGCEVGDVVTLSPNSALYTKLMSLAGLQFTFYGYVSSNGFVQINVRVGSYLTLNAGDIIEVATIGD